MTTKTSNLLPPFGSVLLRTYFGVTSAVKKVFLSLSVISVLSVVQPALAQSGEVKVESKLRIVPSGDIAMGVFQPASSTGGGGGGTGGGGGSTITPPPATGMYGWYRADEVYAETSGSPLSRVTVEGASVGSLKDSSGNNRHMYQTADNRKPILKQNIVNGKPVIRFDGNLHAATNPGDTMGYRGDAFPLNHSIYFVVKKTNVDTSVTNRNLIVDLGVNTYLNFNYGALNTLTHNAGSLQVTIPYSNTKYDILSVSVNTTGTSYLTVGSQVVTSTTVPSSTRGAGFDIGGGIYQNYADMDVAEVIIYSAAQDPNNGDGLNVRKYLDQKYGLGLFTAPTAPPTANQYAWYSADEAYAETTGTPATKVTTDSTLIGSLKDLSTNNRHLLVNGTNSKPTFLTSQVNNKPAIRFDGVDDNLRNQSGAFPVSYSLYLVLKQRAWTSGEAIFSDIGANTLLNQAGTSPNFRSASNASTPMNTTNATLNQYLLVSLVYDAAGNSKLGVGNDFVSTSTSIGTTRGVGFDLGSGIVGSYADFDLAEAIIYNAAQDPTSGDGLTVRKYLDAKYNLGLGINGAQLPQQNLFAGYRSDEAYKDTAVTQLAAVSGTDTIAALKDVTGNGRHLIQSTADQRPLWVSNQRASKPAIRFDGINDFLKTTFNINQPTTVAMLVKQNTRVDARYLMDGATVNSGRISQTSNNYTLSQYAGSSATLDNPNASVGNYLLLYSVFDGANSKFLINNTTAITGNCGAQSMGGLTLGANANGANNSNLDFVEATVYNVALDPATGDGLKVRQYYSDKYALSLFGSTGTPEPTAPTTGMFAQYKADEAYKDINFTQKCTTTNDVILGIKDSSGNNRNLVVTNSSLAPNWQSSVLNSKPVWRGTGSTQLGNSIPLTGQYVIYVVSKFTSNGNYWADNPSFQTQTSPQPANFFATPGIAGGWLPAPAGLALNQWQMTVFQMSGNGYFKIDNNTPTTHPWAPSLSGFVTCINGDGAEILIYTGQHDPNAGDGLLVRKYLNQKYNLGLTLP